MFTDAFWKENIMLLLGFCLQTTQVFQTTKLLLSLAAIVANLENQQNTGFCRGFAESLQRYLECVKRKPVVISLYGSQYESIFI